MRKFFIFGFIPQVFCRMIISIFFLFTTPCPRSTLRPFCVPHRLQHLLIRSRDRRMMVYSAPPPIDLANPIVFRIPHVSRFSPMLTVLATGGLLSVRGSRCLVSWHRRVFHHWPPRDPSRIPTTWRRLQNNRNCTNLFPKWVFFWDWIIFFLDPWFNSTIAMSESRTPIVIMWIPVFGQSLTHSVSPWKVFGSPTFLFVYFLNVAK